MKIVLFIFDYLDYLYGMFPNGVMFFLILLLCLLFVLLLQITDSIISDVKNLFKDR